MAAVAVPAPASRRVLGNYAILEKLGKGSQGKVYRATHVVTGAEVALKTMDLTLLTPDRRARAETEVQALRLLPSHPNIVPLLDVLWDAELPRKRSPDTKRVAVFVLALAQCGELTDYLLLSRFEEAIARTYFKQLLECISHCHENGVAHRDLKPDNIVLDSAFQLCVTDFGLAKVLEDPYSHLRSQVGTKKGGYMAPEVVAHRMYLPEPVDVWSAGVILFIMLAGFPPMDVAGGDDWWFKRLAEDNHRMFWMAHERTARFSSQAKDLLQSMLAVDPSRRIRVEDALKHPFCGGPVVDAAMLRGEMYARRRRICAAKGIVLPLEEVRPVPLAPAAADVLRVDALGAAVAASPGSSSISSSSVSMGTDEPFVRSGARRSIDVSVLSLPDRIPGQAVLPARGKELRDAVSPAAAVDAACPADATVEVVDALPPATRMTWFYHAAADASARHRLLRDIAQECVAAAATVTGDEIGRTPPRARLHVALPGVDARLRIRLLRVAEASSVAPTVVDVICEGADRMHALALYRRILVSAAIAADVVQREVDAPGEGSFVAASGLPISVLLDRTVTDTIHVL